MSFSLGNNAGNVCLGSMQWCDLLTTMQNHDWNPEGTVMDRRMLSDSEEISDFKWDGSYGSNDGQVVIESDAKGMAIALRSYITKLDLFECILGEAGGREMFESPIIAALDALLEAERRARGIAFVFEDDDAIGLDVGSDELEANVEIASRHLENLLTPLRARGEGLEEYTDKGLGWMLVDGRSQSRSLFDEFLVMCDGGAFMIC